MNERRIELVKSPRDTMVDILITVVVGGWLYFTFNPTAFDKLKDNTHDRLMNLVELYVVWQAHRDIQNLPETDDPGL